MHPTKAKTACDAWDELVAVSKTVSLVNEPDKLMSARDCLGSVGLFSNFEWTGKSDVIFLVNQTMGSNKYYCIFQGEDSNGSTVVSCCYGALRSSPQRASYPKRAQALAGEKCRKGYVLEHEISKIMTQAMNVASATGDKHVEYIDSLLKTL
jgi:hypothetical protein